MKEVRVLPGGIRSRREGLRRDGGRYFGWVTRHKCLSKNNRQRGDPSLTRLPSMKVFTNHFLTHLPCPALVSLTKNKFILRYYGLFLVHRNRVVDVLVTIHDFFLTPRTPDPCEKVRRLPVTPKTPPSKTPHYPCFGCHVPRPLTHTPFSFAPTATVPHFPTLLHSAIKLIKLRFRPTFLPPPPKIS